MKNQLHKGIVLGAILVALTIALPSCSSLFPKAVEFGQSKIQAVPKQTPAQEEKVKQGVALAAVKAREAEKTASEDGSAAAIPAGDAAKLSEAVGRSIGPPAEPWKADVQALADKIDNFTAKLDKKLEKFTERNDSMAGKKVEGTGWLQIPYFLWIGIVALVGFAAWTVIKGVLTAASIANPGVAAGVGIAKVGGAVASKALGEIVKGGEAFLKAAKDKFEPAVADKIKELFVEHQERKQSPETQSLVDHLTN